MLCLKSDSISKTITIRSLILMVLLAPFGAVAQVVARQPPKTPTEAWDRVREKEQKEREQLAQQYAALFKAEQWQGEELLSLGQLNDLAREPAKAEVALTAYLSLPKKLDAAEARRVLIKVLIAEKKYEAGVPFADALLAEPDYARPTLSRVQALIESLAASKSKAAQPLFDKTLPGLFRLAANEIKSQPKYGSTLAGMLLSDALKAGQRFREAGDLTDSESLFTIFLSRFETSPLATDLTIAKQVTVALRQVRLVGADAPAVDGIEYVDMPKTPLEALKGKVVLLDFFAHWCKPCIAEFSRLNEIQEKYHATEFQVVGVTTFYGFIAIRKMSQPLRN